MKKKKGKGMEQNKIGREAAAVIYWIGNQLLGGSGHIKFSMFFFLN